MSCSTELEQVIVDGYAEGYKRFGDLGLDFATYKNRIKTIAGENLGASAAPEAVLGFVRKLNCGDLYLATACAKESLGFYPETSQPGNYSSLAWQRLESEYKGFVHDMVRFLFRQTVEVQDFADNLIADLFLPSRSGVSRILHYDGRSSLSTWLRVILAHRAINSQRSLTYRQTTEIEVNMPDRPALTNFNRMVRARLYSGMISQAMSSACNKLLPRERLLLLWRYRDGLQLGEIADLMNIHQSNVSRRLYRLYRKLREHMIAGLLQRGMSQSAVEECLQDVLENPHHGVSLLDCLAAGRNVPREFRPAEYRPRPVQSERSRLYVMNCGA